MLVTVVIVLVVAAGFASAWYTRAPRGRADSRGLIPLGLLLLAESFAILYALLAVWPAVSVESATVPTPVPAATPTPSGGGAVITAVTVTPTDVDIRWYGTGRRSSVTRPTALLFVALLGGALGAQVHATTSFAVHLGAQDYDSSWTWWYLLRPVTGAGLAAILYFVIRGGLFTGNGSNAVNEFGIAAFAGLTGLFSTLAMERLHAIFDAALGSSRETTPAKPAKPVVTAISPQTVAHATAEHRVTLTGTGFASGAVVRIGRTDHKPVSVNDAGTEAVVMVDVSRAGQKRLVVVNPDKQASDPVTLTVT